MSVNTCMSLAQIVGKKTLSSVRYGACTKINVRHNQFTLQGKNILCFLCYFSFHLLTLDHSTTCLSVLYNQWLTLKKEKGDQVLLFSIISLNCLQCKQNQGECNGWQRGKQLVKTSIFPEFPPPPWQPMHACFVSLLNCCIYTKKTNKLMAFHQHLIL